MQKTHVCSSKDPPIYKLSTGGVFIRGDLAKRQISKKNWVVNMTARFAIMAFTVVLGSSLFTSAAELDEGGMRPPPRFEPILKQFFTRKEAQAHALAETEKKEHAPEVWTFFKAGEAGDWGQVRDLYQGLRRGAYQYVGGRK